jgi:hypothetical protein
MLGLLGDVAWLPTSATPSTADVLVIFADPTPLHNVAAGAVRCRSAGHDGGVLVLALPAPEAEIARWLNAGVDLCLPIIANGWYVLSAIHAALGARLAGDRLGEVVRPGELAGRHLTGAETTIMQLLRRVRVSA